MFKYSIFDVDQPSVICSTRNKRDTNTIAKINKMNFLILYLAIENSSVITSTVAIYRKVPKINRK